MACLTGQPLPEGTIFVHNGVEFTLPEQHTATWGEFMNARTVNLYSPGGGGDYYVERVEERAGRKVVHVNGVASGEVGQAGGGESVLPVTGYPFPH